MFEDRGYLPQWGIVRAFLIEEQKCVKQVLAEKLSQAKEKEGGKKPNLSRDKWQILLQSNDI